MVLRSANDFSSKNQVGYETINMLGVTKNGTAMVYS